MKRKTILHIFSGDLWAGAEVMVFNLINRLREDPNLKIMALSLNEGILTNKLREIGIETYVIPESTNSFEKIFFKAVRLLRNKKIDVIHGHRYKENLIGFFLSKVLVVNRLITTIHGLSELLVKGSKAKSTISRKTKLDYFILNRFFSDIVVVSHEISKVLVQSRGFQPFKIKVIHNGIPVPLSTPTRERMNRSFHIGTVGRMVPVKDFVLFLKIAAELRKRSGNLRFSILGDGPLKPQLLEKIRELKIEDCTELLPSRTDPWPYYRSLDIYLNTSLHEGIPLSILEAMGCGKPVVAPEVGGIPEIVLHDENGFLHKTRDPAKFADACSLLLKSESLRTAMGKKNRERINLHFSDIMMCESYKAVYFREKAYS